MTEAVDFDIGRGHEVWSTSWSPSQRENKGISKIIFTKQAGLALTRTDAEDVVSASSVSEQKKQTTIGSQHSHQLAPLEQKHSKEDHTTTRRRQQWSSFGAAAKKNSDGGGDFSVTMRSGEEVFIESPFKNELNF